MKCKCGCGRKTPILKKTHAARGHYKGNPAPYIIGHHHRKRGTVRSNLHQAALSRKYYRAKQKKELLWFARYNDSKIKALLCEAYSNKEIAAKMEMPLRTVKDWFQRSFRRYGIVDGDKRVKLAVLIYREQIKSQERITA